MYKISVNEKLLSIGGKNKGKGISIVYKSPETFVIAFEVLYKTQVKAVHIQTTNKNKVWEAFQKFAIPVYAAGGLVRNDKGKYLFIKRNSIWDLPKGHVEKKETFKKTAIREVEEECSIKNIKIKKYLTTTYHIYSIEKQYYLKVVKWFKMIYKGNENPKPQEEEGIEIVDWYANKEISELMENTYSNIKQLVYKYILK